MLNTIFFNSIQLQLRTKSDEENNCQLKQLVRGGDNQIPSFAHLSPRLAILVWEKLQWLM